MLKSTPSVLPPEEQYIKELESKIQRLQEIIDDQKVDQDTFVFVKLPHGKGTLTFRGSSIQSYEAFDGFVKLFEPRYYDRLKELIALGKRP